MQTSLGYPLVQVEDVWEIDLRSLRIFTGLSVLARVLGDTIIDFIENNPGDVSLHYKINNNMNPELLEMKIFGIQIYARAGILDDVLLFKEDFHSQLRTVFGTFQRPKWGEKIHPDFYEGKGVTRALVFPFHLSARDEIDYQFILERVENSRFPEKYFLRLTIENHDRANLNLESIPHVFVNDLNTRYYIAGTTKIAEAMSDKILNACLKGSFSYSEESATGSTLFEQLEKTRLGKPDAINFYWKSDFIEIFQAISKDDGVIALKKIFLSLEDDVICRMLLDGETIKIDLEKAYISLYLTRRNKVLNFSINSDRKDLGLEYYLKRMPLLEKLANREGHKLDLKGVRVFLIHHITSEILALIDAFRRLKSDALHVMFVKYAGMIPSAYLDALLEIPEKNFYCGGLMRHVGAGNKDYYTLARYYNDIEPYQKLQDYLQEKKLNFFEAMKYSSFYFFLLFLKNAENSKSRVILAEDGGYVAPLLNEILFMKKTVREVFHEYGLEFDENREFSEWVNSILIGTVEHTRNGYDRLAKVIETKGSLKTVSFSIAISNNKVVEESKEVAHSILSAIESILHGQGMILSARKTIVLGAKGNIGQYLCEYMEKARLHENNKELLKVDLKYNPGAEDGYRYLSEIPQDKFLDLDLFIGVIGESILKTDLIEKLILEGTKDKLIFASGSTKTVEFQDLSQWLFLLSDMENSEIKGTPVTITYDRIIDPQTGMIQGTIADITIGNGNSAKQKKLYLLGDLSPINFLFYGVPTEMMDRIITGLASLLPGMLSLSKENKLPSPGLYAVDKEIDTWGQKL